MIIKHPIAIGAGHVPGWNDDPRRDARHTEPLDEWSWNADVVARVGALCSPATACHVCSGREGRDRSEKNALSINERALWANSIDAAGYVEIHHDSGGGNGVLILCVSPAGRAMADVIEAHLAGIRGQWCGPTRIATVGGDSGYRKIAVLSKVTAPAVVIECASMDLAAHDRWFERAAIRDSFARAIVAACEKIVS